MTLLTALALILGGMAVSGLRLSPATARAVSVASALVAASLLTAGLRGVSGAAPDAVSVIVSTMAIASVLVLGLLEQQDSPQQGTLLWNAGLLGLAGTFTHPAALAALLLLMLPLMNDSQMPSGTGGVFRLWQRHAGVLTGTALLVLGLLGLSVLSRDWETGQTIAMACLAVGLGGMLHTFPFPRVSETVVPASLVASFSVRLLPIIAAALLLLRCLSWRPWTTTHIALLAITALIPLFSAGWRLLWENRITRRLALTSVSLFSVLVVALCLAAWDQSRPAHTLHGADGSGLFLTILTAESAAILSVLTGCLLLGLLEQGGAYSETIAGAAVRHPWRSLPLLCGSLSLAGIPPWPGFWWRSSLIGALASPVVESNITGGQEPHFGFLCLSAMMLLSWVLLALGQLRIVQQLLFDSPFRVPPAPQAWNVQLAAGMALAFLLAIAWASSLENATADHMAALTSSASSQPLTRAID